MPSRNESGKVLLVTFSAVPSPGHHGVVVRNMIRALSPRYDLDVLSLRAGELAYVDRLERARMLRVPMSEGDMAEQVAAFRRAVRRQVESNEYDVIHVRSAWAGLPVFQLREHLDGTVIFDLGLSPLGEPRAADEALVAETIDEERYCIERADMVIVPSQAAQVYVRSLGITEHVAVVPSGVDVDAFDWEPPPQIDGPNVLYVGRLGPGRGLRLLVTAFRKVIDRIPARLMLCGPVDPGFRDVLMDVVDRLALDKNISILGAVDHGDVPRVLATADLCVVPQVPDLEVAPLASLPLKLLEYMACRKAVVVPMSPLALEVAGQASCFSYFSSGDVEGMASAMAGLLEHSGERDRLAEAAYERVRSWLTASRSRRALLAVYREILPYSAPSRPEVLDIPGQVAVDPRTTTARRFSTFHDTETLATGDAMTDDGGVRDTETLATGDAMVDDGGVRDRETLATGDAMVDDGGVRDTDRLAAPEQVGVPGAVMAEPWESNGITAHRQTSGARLPLASPEDEHTVDAPGRDDHETNGQEPT